MIKKVLLLVASVFLIWQSYNLLINVHKFEITSWTWTQIILMGWVINMFLTGIFAFAGFALPTQNLLPTSYYEIWNAKKLKRLYRLLRVDMFRKFLLATIWKNKDQRKRYFNGKLDGIENLETQSKKSEFGHLIPFILLNIVSIYLVLIGFFKLGLITFLLNFIGNFYPIVLQRHHRMRIERLKSRFKL